MIKQDFIAKIEGHGNLSVDWSKESVQLNIHEGERLFEGLLVGRTAEEAHWITPRICGVCPIAHNLASLRALEDAYGIQINETSKLLRDLMVCAQMIQSHVLHLFFLVLPDYIGLDSAIELATKDPQAFAKALALKELGDAIAWAIAGRNVHPTTTTIGGFHKIPTKEQLTELVEKIKATREQAEWTLKLFSGLKYPALTVDLELVALGDNGEVFANSSGSIGKNRNDKFSVKDYKTNTEESIRDYSTAKFGKFRGKEMMIGSLARLAIHGAPEKLAAAHLGASTEKLALDFTNPFHNILAQAIELLQYHKKAEEIIGKLFSLSDYSLSPLLTTNYQLQTTSQGVGAIEAPRGGLYHEIHLDQNGIITYANIITPTAQNLTSMEKSAQALLSQTKDKSQTERERLLNMLIRSYDPCITCAVH